MPYSFPGIPFDGPPLDNENITITTGNCRITTPVEECSESPVSNCGGTFSINEVGSYGSTYGLNYGYGNIPANGNITVDSSAYCPGYFAFMVVSATCSDGTTRILDSFISAGVDANGNCPASEYNRSFVGVCCPAPETRCVTRDVTINVPITAAISWEAAVRASQNPRFLDNLNNDLRNIARNFPQEVFNDLVNQLSRLPESIRNMFTVGTGPDGRPVIRPVTDIDDYLRIIGREVTPENRNVFRNTFNNDRARFMSAVIDILERPIGGTPGFTLTPGAGRNGGPGFVPRPPGSPAGGGGIIRAILRGGSNFIRGIIGIGGVGAGLIEIIPVLEFPLQTPGGQRMDCAFNSDSPNGGGDLGLIGDTGITSMPTAILASNSPSVSSMISNNLLMIANNGSPYSTFPSAITPSSEYL